MILSGQSYNNVLIHELSKLKTEEASHVSIDYNCDHDSYEVHAYKLKHASHNDINIYEQRKLTDREKELKILELTKEIIILK